MRRTLNSIERLTVLNLKKLGALLCLCGATWAPTVWAGPHDAAVTALMSKALSDMPGKEMLAITVTYPPGGFDPVHRHDAHAFVYVLEGAIVMQVKGSKEVTLKPGQSFYEGPEDVHTVGRNASKTKPAKFLVLLLKNKDAPVLLPAQ